MAAMTVNVEDKKQPSEYLLGYTDAEHDRLIRQATLIAPFTERLFREAGIGQGQRVLDLGSGVGDVSMMVSRLVGPSGEVVGVERDANSIGKAKLRVSAMGIRNVSFVQADVSEIADGRPFDACVGRFILHFVPEPLSVLRSLARRLRPGGILAFQEPSFIPMIALCSDLPLWSRVLRTARESGVRCGVNPEIGLELYRLLPQLGLPAPKMHIDVLLNGDGRVREIMLDAFRSLLPQAKRHKVPLEEVGDLNTLAERVDAEIAAANTAIPFLPLVNVWTRNLKNS